MLVRSQAEDKVEVHLIDSPTMMGWISSVQLQHFCYVLRISGIRLLRSKLSGEVVCQDFGTV